MPTHPQQRDEAREPTGPFQRDDVLVELTRVDAFEAEVAAVRLRGAGIPAAVFGVGTAGQLSAVQYTEGSRVMVRSCDREAAATVIAELFGDGSSPDPIDDDELGALAEESKGWSDPSTGAVV